MPPRKAPAKSKAIVVEETPGKNENQLCSALEALLIVGGAEAVSGLKQHGLVLGSLTASLKHSLAERSGRSAVKYARQSLGRAADKTCELGKVLATCLHHVS
jgi:hypothetical protein